jgi:glycosyltransferase involved in cell wall biosynthesis
MVSRLLDLLRKPYILSLHGGNLIAFASRWPGRVKRLLQNANLVTAPSPYLQTAMRSYRNDIVLIPNPLDIHIYPFRLRSMAKPHLIWLRAFHNIYNPQMAPLLVANLLPFFPETTLTMIGPDKGDGSLQTTQTVIEELGLQDHIRILPGIPKNEVSAYLGCADIFINTTNVDNTPVSVLEAMACGLCVVSTDVGGIPHLLDDGQDALLVPPNNPETMTNAIKRILTESGLAAWLSANAGKKADWFDWPVLLPKWESVFEQIIQAC